MPCGGCNRHVRIRERSCPFCGATLALSEPLTELRLLTRLDRSRLVALGALLSAAGIALGCREQKVVMVHGAPARSVGSSASSPPSVPPPADTGSAAPTGTSGPTGAPVAVYGAPPRMPEPTSGPRPR
jgi:hypothetical protein